MTGPTSVLAPWQIAELREFADGKPHRPARRPTALLRRGMLMSVGKHGETAYLITAFGRSALTLHENRLVTPRTGAIRSQELFGRDHWDALPIIEEDAIYPRDEDHRYRIYARRGDDIEVLACAGSPAALGVALVQLDEDERDRGRRLIDLGAIGILDAVEGRWLLMPWHRPEIPVTVGPSPEEQLARLYSAGWRIADDGDPYRPLEDEGR